MRTVGACARDQYGNLASATSTGGRGFERPGRVSDSCTPAGNYANNLCAVSATGTGEEIMDEALAVRIVTRVIDGMTLEKAFEKTFAEVRSRNHQMGAIGVDHKGNLSHATTTELLIYGWRDGKRVQIFEK
jgi:L-asparaginase